MLDQLSTARYDQQRFPFTSSSQLSQSFHFPARNTRLQNLSIALVLHRLPSNHAAIQRIPNTPPNALLQRHNRPVPQSALRLINIEVPRNASIRNPLRRKRRLAFPQHPENPLEHKRNKQAQIARKRPRRLRVRGIAHFGPAAAREIEEVDWLVVGIAWPVEVRSAVASRAARARWWACAMLVISV
jgi:hypothetical protein